MTDAERIEATRRLEHAEALAPLIADKLRPHIRTDVWQSAVVCSVAVGFIVYFLSRADVDNLRSEMRAQASPIHQVQTMNAPPAGKTREDLIHDVLEKQGQVK